MMDKTSMTPSMIVATIGSAEKKRRKGKLTMTAEMMDMTMVATTRHLLPL